MAKTKTLADCVPLVRFPAAPSSPHPSDPPDARCSPPARSPAASSRPPPVPSAPPRSAPRRRSPDLWRGACHQRPRAQSCPLPPLPSFPASPASSPPDREGEKDDGACRDLVLVEDPEVVAVEDPEEGTVPVLAEVLLGYGRCTSRC